MTPAGWRRRLRRGAVLVLAPALLAGYSAAGGRTETGAAAPARARNVILFLGDAAGIPTLHAASVLAHDRPRALFIHQMPHVALVETSSALRVGGRLGRGHTAIVTGHKTHNGVVAQSDAAVRRVRDGAPLKTILEHAEERGLSTGVVSNSSVLSATPAACYAHVNDRGDEVEALRQLLEPRFGDGVGSLSLQGRRVVLVELAGLEGLLPLAGAYLDGLTLRALEAHIAGVERKRSNDVKGIDRAHRQVVLFDSPGERHVVLKLIPDAL